MLLDNLVPYAKNARHNDNAVPVVAQSIKDFGFKGAIVCDRTHEGGSYEHPIIVNGHTRVKALKSLGYTEIPDEWIVYCDDLTEDEIRALRLADNKSAEVATWNKTLLQHEVRDLSKLNMEKFGFNFKSKTLPYGFERTKTDRAYNLNLVNRFDCNSDEMPSLEPCEVVPDNLQGFNYAKTEKQENKKSLGCHFFIDDYQFERVWTRPEYYLPYLKDYACVLTCDFSLYQDMPYPMQRWNIYRSRALGYFWQKRGLKVIPTLTWSDKYSFKFCFDGLPARATYATSTVGVMNDKDAQKMWMCGMQAALERLSPERLLLYGQKIDFDFGTTEVIYFKNHTTERMSHGR